MVLQWNKLEFHSPKDASCQVKLKLAKWFWRRRCETLTDGRTKSRTFSSGELKAFQTRQNTLTRQQNQNRLFSIFCHKTLTKLASSFSFSDIRLIYKMHKVITAERCIVKQKDIYSNVSFFFLEHKI